MSRYREDEEFDYGGMGAEELEEYKNNIDKRFRVLAMVSSLGMVVLLGIVLFVVIQFSPFGHNGGNSTISERVLWLLGIGLSFVCIFTLSFKISDYIVGKVHRDDLDRYALLRCQWIIKRYGYIGIDVDNEELVKGFSDWLLSEYGMRGATKDLYLADLEEFLSRRYQSRESNHKVSFNDMLNNYEAVYELLFKVEDEVVARLGR